MVRRGTIIKAINTVDCLGADNSVFFHDAHRDHGPLCMLLKQFLFVISFTKWVTQVRRWKRDFPNHLLSLRSRPWEMSHPLVLSWLEMPWLCCVFVENTCREDVISSHTLVIISDEIHTISNCRSFLIHRHVLRKLFILCSIWMY